MKEGASVIINGRTAPRIQQSVYLLQHEIPGCKITGITADFEDTQQVAYLVKQAGNIDILINNIGIFERMPFFEIPDADWFKFLKEARPTSLLQRFAAVDEVASMVTYLVSPLSSATNGAAIRVDGGVVKHIL